MNNYLILTKALIRNTFRRIYSDKKSIAKPIIFFILIGLTLLPLEIGLVSLVAVSYILLHEIGQEGIILGLGLSAVSSVIFFFGIFYIISVFYFSKDIENLLPLPLKPAEILGAKFTITIMFEYITEAMFFLPIIITYGVISGSGIAFYLSMMFIFLFLPVIPLVLASIIDMIIMGFTSVSKTRDRFRLFGGIAAIVIALGLNIVAQRNAGSAAQVELRQMLINGHNSAMAVTSKLFPSTKFGVNALLNYNNINGLSNLIIFFAINAAFLIIYILLGNLLYFKGAVGSSEVSVRKHSSVKSILNQAVQKPVLISYISKELKILVRTPIYFLNCILMNFIWPVFIFLPIIARPGSLRNVEMIRVFLHNPVVAGVIVAIMFSAGALLSAANGITSTAISREGQNIFITKFIPTEFKTQILAKVLSGSIMGILGFVITMLPTTIVLRPPFYLMLLSLVIGIIGNLFTAFTGIIIDLYYPKLIWDNEQKAVKQNLNVLLNMLITAILGGIVILPTILLKLTPSISFTSLAIIFGLLDVLLYKFINTRGRTAFENIEI